MPRVGKTGFTLCPDAGKRPTRKTKTKSKGAKKKNVERKKTRQNTRKGY